MFSRAQLKNIMSVLLLFGTFTAIIIVIIGGVKYLTLFGGETFKTSLLGLEPYQTSVRQILSAALTFSPEGIIEFGLLILVLTQLFRVMLLLCYYAIIRDYWFILISLIITLILTYSLFWRT